MHFRSSYSLELQSPTRWTWIWVSSGSWWWTGKPGVLTWGSRVGHDWVTELNWKYWNHIESVLLSYSGLLSSRGVRDPELSAVKSMYKFIVSPLYPWKWKSLSYVWLYRSGYSFPSPGDLPNPGTEPRSPSLQADSLPVEPQGKPFVSMDSTNHRSCSTYLLKKIHV